MPKIVKFFLISFALFLFLLSCLSGLVLYAVSLLLDEDPMQKNLLKFNQKDLFGIIQKVTAIHGKIATAKEGETDSIKLTANEVNSIIFLLEHRREIHKIISGKTITSNPDKDYNIIFKDNYFIIDYSHNIGISTPFGSYLNIRAKCQPVIHDDIEEIDVESLKIGDMPFPPSLFEDTINSAFQSYARRVEDTTFREIIKEVKIENNHLIIEYDSYKCKELIKPYIKSFLKKVLPF